MDKKSNKNRLYDRILPPHILFPIAIAGILIIIASLFLEYRSRRNDYLSMLESRSKVFLKTILETAGNTYTAATELEKEINSNLYSYLNIIERIDRKSKITDSILDDIVDVSDFREVRIFDRNLDVVAFSKLNIPAPISIQPSLLETILEYPTGNELYVIPDTVNYEDDYLAAIVKREKGGVIAGIISGDKIQHFRRIFGFGQILKSFTDEGSVEYVVLENEQTIIAGFFQDYRLSSFSADDFLRNEFKLNEIESRIIEYEQGKIYETVAAFVFENETVGLFRLGLSMADLDIITTRANRRMFVFSGLMVVIGFILINFSMSNRHRQMLKEELSYLSEYTNTILENLQSGVITIDAKGRIKVVNRQASKFIGLEYADVFDKSYETLPEIFSNTIGQSVTESIGITKKLNYTPDVNQDSKWLSFRTTILKENDNENNCILLLDDVTEQVQIEEQKLAIEKLTAMRKLASGVAHEIRNPLNSINLIVDLLKLDYIPTDKTDKYNKYISTVQREIGRISLIVEEFLRFARPPKLDKAPMDLGEFFDDIGMLYQPRMKSDNISLHIEIKAHTEILGDHEQLKQVFINLLENAIQACGNKGSISISGEVKSNDYEIIVSDTGIGISEYNLKHIFDLYFTTKKKGSGIGLAIVHQIITNHQGSIKAESEEGKGTKIAVKLPMVK